MPILYNKYKKIHTSLWYWRSPIDQNLLDAIVKYTVRMSLTLQLPMKFNMKEKIGFTIKNIAIHWQMDLITPIRIHFIDMIMRFAKHVIKTAVAYSKQENFKSRHLIKL